MKIDIPALDQFALQAVDHVKFRGPNEELKFSVRIEPQSITNRVLVALLDPVNNQGMAVGVYPATGEVCDLCNEGGVIGYLSEAPLNPADHISCELVIYRFGKNFVCNAVINGETFLYPASSWDCSGTMTAVVGKESHNGDLRFKWNSLNVELQELNGVIAA